MSEKMREAFEAWISAPPFEHDCKRRPMDERLTCWPGQYKRYETQMAWEAWQAALAEQPAQGDAVSFLANGARFKLAALPRSAAFMSFPAELAGKWVALVDATDDRHLLLKAPPAPIVPDELKAAIEWAAGVCHDEGWDRTDAEKKHLAALKRVYLAAAPEVEK